MVNYDLPDNVDDYVHRAGPHGGAATPPVSSPRSTWLLDKEMIREIERAIGQVIPRCTVTGVEAYVEMVPRRMMGRRRR